MKSSSLANFARSWAPIAVVAVLLLLAPLVLTDFRQSQLARFLTLAIAAIGLDLIWGYGGMLSLGQGLFFGLGAYGFAMHLKLQASGDKLPDFMFWSGLTELPWFWQPFASPVVALLAALLIPTLIAGVLGWFIFRSRVQGVYFSIITQALTLLTSIFFVGHGITNLGAAQFFGHGLLSPEVQDGLYLTTVVLLLGVLALYRWLTRTRFGRVLVASRDDESRLRFLGYNPVTVKVLVFSLSALIAALGGILYVPQVGIISPSSLAVVPSIELVIFVALGGRGTLLGALIGTLLVSYGRSYFSESYPDLWTYFLGILFVASVLFFPQGVTGSLQDALQGLRARRRSATANSPSLLEPATGSAIPTAAEGGSS
jgi:urea transport system permease protein